MLMRIVHVPGKGSAISKPSKPGSAAAKNVIPFAVLVSLTVMATPFGSRSERCASVERTVNRTSEVAAIPTGLSTVCPAGIELLIAGAIWSESSIVASASSGPFGRSPGKDGEGATGEVRRTVATRFASVAKE